MAYRVAVLHQGFIPLYRVRLFEKLNALGTNEYVVFHGAAPSGTGHVAATGPFSFPQRFKRNYEFSLGGRTLIYQGVIQDVVGGGFDAAVLGAEFKLLGNLAIFSAFKAIGKPVILWGHGLHRPDSHWIARTSSRAFSRFADGYLAYTDGGAARLQTAGLSSDRIFVIRNTVDLDEEIALHAEFQATPADDLKRELGLRPGVPTLLYMGRLYARKRCHDLIEAARRLSAEGQIPFDVAMVGDGPERAELEAAAAGLDNVRFFGAIYCTRTAAKLMRVAAAMVNPGSVGLAVNHCFAHGVPVITRAGMLHSPEFEYIRDGENGIVVEGGIDELTAAVRRILADGEFRARLAEGALATRAMLGLDYMVESFDRGVTKTIERVQADRMDRMAQSTRSRGHT